MRARAFFFDPGNTYKWGKFKLEPNGNIVKYRSSVDGVKEQRIVVS